ncbi:MAG: hypothetical protein V3S33_00840 [Gammaproteobacteria bacterium]
MLRRHLITFIFIVVVCLASSVSVAAPAVKSVTPAAVTLQAGKSTTVELNGQRLNQARKAVVIGPRDTRPVRGLTAKLQRGPATQRALTLKAGKNTRPGTYRVMLTGNAKVILPLSIQITKATTKQVSKTSTNKNTSLAQSRGQSNANLTVKNVPTQTPMPDWTEGSSCPVVVTYSWNVSNDFPSADRVRWELKKDTDFQNPSGQEPNRLASQSVSGSNGSVIIDLRDYGQVLNGTKYYFRIVAKNGNQDLALRSNAVLVDYTPPMPSSSSQMSYTVERRPDNEYGVTLGWGLKYPIAECSDHAFYEIKKGSPFQNQTGVEPNRVAFGSLNGASGSTNLNLASHGPGTYYFRVFGKYGGNSVDSDVGKRGGTTEFDAMGLPTTMPDVSFTISDGAATTSNSNVQLKLTVSAPASWSWPAGVNFPHSVKFRFHQTGGDTDPGWTIVSTANAIIRVTRQFALVGSAGNKTVTAEVQVAPRQIGPFVPLQWETIVLTDNILWTTSAPAGAIKQRPKNIQNTLDLDPRLRPPNQ